MFLIGLSTNEYCPIGDIIYEASKENIVKNKVTIFFKKLFLIKNDSAFIFLNFKSVNIIKHNKVIKRQIRFKSHLKTLKKNTSIIKIFVIKNEINKSFVLNFVINNNKPISKYILGIK
tara:strand:- start:216 stop:569 length:354 start_codon:yes stop_codon:yes gene_type:complete